MELNRDNILHRTDRGLNIFKHFIPFEFSLTKNFHNPLYRDTNPSCSIYLDRGLNVYRLTDFGDSSYSGDCFHYVGLILGCDSNNSHSFIEIMNYINESLTLGLYSKQINNQENKSLKIKSNRDRAKTNRSKLDKVAPDRVKQLSYKEKVYSKEELEYWATYGVDMDTLSFFNVLSLEYFESAKRDGESFRIESTSEQPMFGYPQSDSIKIYRPKSKSRFLYGGNKPEEYCFGLDYINDSGDFLIITGGEKDVLSLWSHGFTAISFNSETAHIPADMIRQLQFSYKHVVLIYDVDETGLKSSLKHQQQLESFSVKRLVLPLDGTKEEKDISDYFRLGYKREDLIELLYLTLDSQRSVGDTLLSNCIAIDKNLSKTDSPIVSINSVPLGIIGDILCITGAEGTGKSSYIGAIIAGALNSTVNNIDTLGTTVAPNTAEKAVLLYDTEQTLNQVHKHSRNALKRAGVIDSPHFFKPYAISNIPRADRLRLITQNMDKHYFEFNGIHLVVIDGIADLIYSVNDERESVTIIEELSRLAKIYNTCIIGVLHYTPNSTKIRGHLGSEIHRKATAILSIEKKKSSQVSVVKSLKVRDGDLNDVPDIDFAWDDEIGMHAYKGELRFNSQYSSRCADSNIENNSHGKMDRGVEGDKDRVRRKKDKQAISLDVANTLFQEATRLSYKELYEGIQVELSLGVRSAKEYVRLMRDYSIIDRDPTTTQAYYTLGKKEEI